MKQSDGRGHLPLLISAEMKNMNGGYGSGGGVSLLTSRSSTAASNSNSSSRGLGGQRRSDLVNGNYSTTINVAHNKNNNGNVGGSSGGRGEMNVNGGGGMGGGGTWRDSQGSVQQSRLPPQFVFQCCNLPHTSILRCAK